MHPDVKIIKLMSALMRWFVVCRRLLFLVLADDVAVVICFFVVFAALIFVEFDACIFFSLFFSVY